MLFSMVVSYFLSHLLLHCGAEWCRVLQRVAAWCIVMQCVAMCSRVIVEIQFIHG